MANINFDLKNIEERAWRERLMYELAKYEFGRELMGPQFAALPTGLDVEADNPRAPAIDPAKLEALKTAEPYKVSQRTPDRMEVITAWRCWSAVEYEGRWRLKALGKTHLWEPRKQIEAVCADGGKHPAPHLNCKCGIWAFKELDNLVAATITYKSIQIIGNVALWGRVIETENGYRAQYAYPSELWILDDSLEELGLTYDVPVRMARTEANHV